MLGLGETVERLDKQPLKVVVETARQVQQRHLAGAAARKSVEDQLRLANAERGRKETLCKAAIKAWNDWENRWQKALVALHLPADMLPELVDQRCDMIEQMRGLSGEIDELRRNRIEKIERDIAGYETAVQELTGQVADDLATMAVDAAVLELGEAPGDRETDTSAATGQGCGDPVARGPIGYRPTDARPGAPRLSTTSGKSRR